jgi:hypothetical protein
MQGSNISALSCWRKVRLGAFGVRAMQCAAAILAEMEDRGFDWRYRHRFVGFLVYLVNFFRLVGGVSRGVGVMPR